MFMIALFTSMQNIVATSQHRAVSQVMFLNGLSTDKQSFACLMQVAIIEVCCCQLFF